MPILDDVARYHEELRAIRQDIHANPELGLEEYRTADLVAAKLEEWGIEVHRGVGGTGVVGVLRSGNGPGAIGCARIWTHCPSSKPPTSPTAAKITA